jgi:hypothetical protein
MKNYIMFVAVLLMSMSPLVEAADKPLKKEDAPGYTHLAPTPPMG